MTLEYRLSIEHENPQKNKNNNIVSTLAGSIDIIRDNAAKY